VFSIAVNTLYTTLGKRGTIWQLAAVIVVCVLSGLVVLPAMIWYNSHFVAHQEMPATINVAIVLAGIAFFGWLLPLGTTTTYCLFSRSRTSNSITNNSSNGNNMTVRLPNQEQPSQVEQYSRPTNSLLPLPHYQPGATAPFAYEDESPWGWLEYASGNFQGQRLALKRIVAMIGRDENCEIWLDDEMASRYHAELAWFQEQAYLTDCGSLNGVLCKGQRVHGSIPLQDKDSISIGTHHFLFIRAEHKQDPLADDDPLNRHTWRSTEDLLSESSKQEVIGLNRSTQQSSTPQKHGALTFCDGTLVGRTVAIDRPVLTVGCDPGCHIVVMDDSILPQHARILNYEGDDYIQAISNRQDTFVNNDVLLGSRRLQPGDVIGLGNLHMIYVSMSPPISPTTSQPGIVTPPSQPGNVTSQPGVVRPFSQPGLRNGPLPLRLPSRQK
jgi:pSer/pThr/pTyr-binding forkhead associated (FHA) protein